MAEYLRGARAARLSSIAFAWGAVASSFGFSVVGCTADAGDAATPGSTCESCGDVRAAPTGGEEGATDAGDGGSALPCDCNVSITSARLLDWARLDVGRQTRAITSFDRTGGNDDGFSGTYSSLYEDDGSYAIFDARGPGALTTLWFTSGISGNAPLGTGALSFFFDDETAPRLQVDADALFAGKTAPFVSPLVFDNHASTGGFVSFVPLPYATRLVVKTKTRPAFLQSVYERYPNDAKVTSWTPGADDATLAELFGNAGALGSAVGLEPVALDVSKTGSGAVVRIRYTATPAETDAALHAARVTITFDDASAPQVDVPLDMFFGSGLGRAKVSALAFTMAGDVFENRFPMPFRTGFHLSVSGAAGALAIETHAEFDTTGTGTFHALHHREAPTKSGEDFEYAHVSGFGKLVGTVLTVRPSSPTSEQWWEGDLRSYVDGARTPVIHGTGHEDDFFGGWSNEFFDGPFTLPLHGLVKSEPLDRDGQFNANISAYRLYPGLSFLSELRHSTEHGASNHKLETYESVTFVYKTPAPVLVEVDRVDPNDAASRAAHAYTAIGESSSAILSSAFEGRESGVLLSHAHRTHTGKATFTAKTTGAKRGLVVRRLYDQATPRQHARIRVGETDAGSWYAPEGNATLRWAERDYFIPASALVAVGDADSSTTLTIAPETPTAWDVGEYVIFAVTE